MERFFEELKKFESDLRLAKESGYTRNIVLRNRRRLYEIHRELTGSGERFKAICKACNDKLMTELGILYFDYKQTRDAESLQPVEIPAEVAASVPETALEEPESHSQENPAAEPAAREQEEPAEEPVAKKVKKTEKQPGAKAVAKESGEEKPKAKRGRKPKTAGQ